MIVAHCFRSDRGQQSPFRSKAARSKSVDRENVVAAVRRIRFLDLRHEPDKFDLIGGWWSSLGDLPLVRLRKGTIVAPQDHLRSIVNRLVAK